VFTGVHRWIGQVDRGDQVCGQLPAPPAAANHQISFTAPMLRQQGDLGRVAGELEILQTPVNSLDRHRSTPMLAVSWVQDKQRSSNGCAASDRNRIADASAFTRCALPGLPYRPLRILAFNVV
jgi:hypothetical protein